MPAAQTIAKSATTPPRPAPAEGKKEPTANAGEGARGVCRGMELIKYMRADNRRGNTMNANAKPAPTGEGAKKWILVHTKPQSERVAERNLCNQEYEVYLPLYRRKTRGGERVAALFPRYLFVRVEYGVANLSPINYTKGVARIVKFGAQVACVPDALIDKLRAAEIKPPPLKRGDVVNFTDDMLRAYEAIFECETGRDRVIVLLNIAGLETRVTLPASSVRPA